VKKLIITLVTAGAFAAYSLGVRHHLVAIIPRMVTTALMDADDSGPPSGTTGATSGTASGSSVGNGTPATTPPANYKDGGYTGSTEDAYYGNVQVAVTVAGGKITKVSFLQYPHTHSTSVVLNQFALPDLRQEAIKAQSSDVQIISGATFTSQAFIKSLSTALDQAKKA